MTNAIVVETVVPLSAEQKKAVSVLLKAKCGSAEFTERINSSLLGGIRVLVGSTEYDASLSGKLAQLRSLS